MLFILHGIMGFSQSFCILSNLKYSCAHIGMLTQINLASLTHKPQIAERNAHVNTHSYVHINP